MAIDVNSGKATQNNSVEETAFKTNIEAANEIARQLKLRDLAGLVVIDFIDMYEQRHRRMVEKELRDALKKNVLIWDILPTGGGGKRSDPQLNLSINLRYTLERRGVLTQNPNFFVFSVIFYVHC